jgi:quinolinate synthase
MAAVTNALARTSPLYDRVKRVIPPFEWPAFAGDVDAILELKRKRNAVVLAHNYQTPEIFHCVADIVGDSLLLAREATKVDADIIVLAGVHFMAETAKLLNPEKTVLIPDLAAGCSLADSITAADVRLMRERYPGAPVVAYVNTSTAVKAESDICCTSGNALAVVESLGAERVIMLPDEYLAQNIAAQTQVKIIAWKGHCEVHELFTAADVRQLREDHPDVTILAHFAMPLPRDNFHLCLRGDVGLCREAAPGPSRAADRVLHERQRRGASSRCRIHPAMQSVPAHEAHHAQEHPPRAGDRSA